MMKIFRWHEHKANLWLHEHWIYNCETWSTNTGDYREYLLKKLFVISMTISKFKGRVKIDKPIEKMRW